ncbi:MAG: ATP-binding cassette domain-containing protein [Clostridiales bacterium]|jgi:ABC-type lipoprotein export system ATPase subunit/ABC-type antimicrobial peptide transport system permease subunit|nr:ATP-binding cassette domain-containing protein [Clostridiales bacterium]
MLELKNISKTYKSKRSNDCAAVRNISVNFGDSGLVFVCGKSGSGKSTLLNLMSGMDMADSGEIIIEGKSSKDFKQPDFDIYRNTYVGFVFQDFNIIEELSIKENIAMSLKLQGRDADDESIKNALRQVGLEGYESRRSSELSGGQRQRISIARALIKNPKIIFADEPTGSLDAATGVQIFELFKELSKTRLVIIVSHDADSALVYGDRLIEMNDGVVVSDKTKVSDVDLGRIKFEYQRRIDRSFVATQDESGSKNKPRFESIKTKLPIKHALKISVSNFKQRKGRFFITILLTVVALAVFGLSDIMKNYNYHTASLNTFESIKVNTLLAVNTRYVYDDNGEIDIDELGDPITEAIVYTEDDIKKLQAGISTAYRAYRFNVTIPRYSTPPAVTTIYNNRIQLFVEMGKSVDSESLNGFYHASLIAGHYPRTNKNAVEILISDFIADSIMFFGAKLKKVDIFPNTGYESILNQVLEYSGYSLKIVGIYSTNYKSMDFQNRERRFEYNFNMQNIYTAALTTENALYGFAVKSNVFQANGFLSSDVNSDKLGVNLSIIGSPSAYYVFSATEGVQVKYIDGYNHFNSLKGNEVIIGSSLLGKLLGIGEYYGFIDVVTEDFKNLKLNFGFLSDDRASALKNMNIIGVFDDAAYGNTQNAVVMSESAKDICIKDGMIVANMFVPLTGNRAVDERMLTYMESNMIRYATYATTELAAMDKIFDIIIDVFDMASLVLFLFVLLLMYNFISSGIMAKKKEIGILRAMGARGVDIAKIFVLEDAAIIMLDIILTIIFMNIGAFIINASLTRNFSSTLSILSPDLSSILYVVISCIIMVILSSALPLIRIIKMKPIDAIKNN